jgi:serine/threonine-protein kinase RsbW
MDEIPNVSLSLSNAPESVVVVQQALGGVALVLGLDALETNDLNTAVTEACNNVVLHAYEGMEGPLEVEVYALAGALDVVVRDRGIGIRPHVGERTQPHTGLGMPIVHALTQRVAFSKLDAGGTEMRMQFTTPDAAALGALEGEALESQIAGADGGRDTTAIALAPSSVVRAVLPRVLGALAKRARFSTDGTSDVQLVADTLAANAKEFTSVGQLGVTVDLAPDALELRIGPLPAGAAARLLDACVDADGRRLAIERLPHLRGEASCNSTETLALLLRECC